MAGNIICITGKSASGKDTFFHALLQRCPELLPVIPYTTRPKRAGEKDGVEYHFVTPEQFRKLERMDEIIEKRRYDTVHGIWYYFTRRMTLNPQKDYLLITTPDGVRTLAHTYTPQHIRVVYLNPDEQTRMERCKKREDAQQHPDYAEMHRRFQADQRDFSPERLHEQFNGITHVLELDSAQSIELCLNAWQNWYNSAKDNL